MVSRNIKILEWVGFLRGINPLCILRVVYFGTITNSYATAMAVLSLSSLVQAISEIPTGIFSDKIGRKNTWLISNSCFFIRALFWGSAGLFDCIPLLFIGAVFCGLGNSLISGTDDALMYETVEEVGDEYLFRKLFSKVQALYHIGYLFSISLAFVAIYFFHSSKFALAILAYLSVVPILVEMLLMFLFTEAKTKKTNIHTNSSFKHFKEAFLFIMRNKKLRLFSVVKIFAKVFDTSMKRIEPVYYSTLVPLYMVTVVGMIKEVFISIGYFFVSVLKKFGLEKFLFISEYLISGIRLIGVTFNNFLTPFINITTDLFSGISDTAQISLLQQEFSEVQRATMSSIISLISSLLFAIIFYGLGIVADVYSFKIVILILIVMKLLITTFSYLKFRKLKL